jgi:hypothetical protein
MAYYRKKYGEEAHGGRKKWRRKKPEHAATQSAPHIAPQEAAPVPARAPAPEAPAPAPKAGGEAQPVQRKGVLSRILGIFKK